LIRFARPRSVGARLAYVIAMLGAEVDDNAARRLAGAPERPERQALILDGDREALDRVPGTMSDETPPKRRTTAATACHA
jgi:hypothetical protein